MSKGLFVLLGLLLAAPAHADVYAQNDISDINNNVFIRVEQETVGRLLIPHLEAVITIPPRANKQYHVIRLCHNGVGDSLNPWVAASPFFEVKPLGQASTCMFSRVVSAWGTLLNFPAQSDTNLFRAQQINNVVQFHAGQNFDDYSLAPPHTTNGLFYYRGAKGCWPAGLAGAAWLRLEVQRSPGFGAGPADLGLAQMNVLAGNNVTEGTTNEGNMGFRTMDKKLARVGQVDGSGLVRLVIPPGPKDGMVAVAVSDHSGGQMYCWGFELRPQPTVSLQ